MFYSEGNFSGKVLEIVLAESRFSPNDPDAFDICIHVQGPECDGKNQDGWWRGEVSGKYGRGNFANKTQYEITMDALHQIGFEGEDLSELESQLVGTEINYKVESREYNGKTYYDVKYIGGGDYKPKPISMDSVADKLSSLKAKTSGSPPTQPKQTAQEPEEDLPW